MQLRRSAIDFRSAAQQGPKVPCAEGVPAGQLTAWAVLAVIACAPVLARADNHAEVSTSVFEENRDGGHGGLTVVHPEAGFGVDLGQYVTLDAGYAADAVSGATATIYQPDAITQATRFSDTRHAGTVRIGFQGRQSKIGFTASVGTERDYLSHSIGGDASVDLPGRNTTIDLAYTHSFDQVCDKDNGMAMPLERRALTGADPCNKTAGLFGKNDPGETIWQPLSIDTAQSTLTQNLTPTLNMQIALYGQILQGFQSNPYRRVLVGSASPQEHIPDTRARWSLTARFNRYLPAVHGAAHFSARFYDDTWRVIGGDAELAYSQYVGQSLLLYFHARVYQQTAASFFKDAFYYMTESSAGEYFTGDRELSPVRDAILGARLSVIDVAGDKKVWHVLQRLQLNVKGDVLLLDRLPADDLADNPMGIDKQFLYGNSLLDAILLQLDLQGQF